MAISSAGIGSGLDINSLVRDLLNAESVPKTAQFDRKEAVFQTQISSYGILKSALSDLRSSLTNLTKTETFNNRTASSSSTETFTATADSTAVVGSYTINVDQIAEAHKLSSTGFTDSATVIGTGTLTVSVGSDSFNLTIDDSNKTVAGIRDAINDASDNTGITATTINVDDGVGGTETRLVLTSNSSGTDNAITITAVNGGEGDLQQLVYDPAPGSGVTNLVERNAAVDAIVLVDGQTVTSSSNTLSNTIEGVTIDLLTAAPVLDTDHTVSISLNTGTIAATINNVVDKYNEFVGVINSLTEYNEDDANGALLGDSLARGIEIQVRQTLTQRVSSITSNQNNSLAAIGITTNNDGTMSVNAGTLTDAIGEDLASITELFSATDGIATDLDSVIDSYVKFDGVLDAKTDSVNASIDRITDQREQLALRLESMESRLLAQFIAMDSLVAQLTASGEFLTSALKGLPEPNSINR